MVCLYIRVAFIWQGNPVIISRRGIGRLSFNIQRSLPTGYTTTCHRCRWPSAKSRGFFFFFWGKEIPRFYCYVMKFLTRNPTRLCKKMLILCIIHFQATLRGLCHDLDIPFQASMLKYILLDLTVNIKIIIHCLCDKNLCSFRLSFLRLYFFNIGFKQLHYRKNSTYKFKKAIVFPH